MSTEANPARIGRYEIQKPLGSGAMGDVFLAHDPNIGRLVAIKTVRVTGGNDEDIADRRGRLLREARAAGKFVHPNVVALYDAGEANGLLYLAFEYVPGQDLLKRARQAPEMTLREVLRVVRETASALDYAQSENVVHRDIKPSNILLGPKGVAKVADFGIAKLHDQSVELTRTGSVVGSPQYMSPEQIRGEDLDGRSDIFSLGVVFYELLSRTRPFGGDTISTLVFEILAKEPPPIESLRPGLPHSLVHLVRSMMVKDRNHRIADAGKVVESIQALEREIPAAELDRPASQASGADGLPTQLMPSGQQGLSQTVPTPSPMTAHGAQSAGYGQPLPFATGPQTPVPFASSTPSGQLPGVPMGAPLPSGPLAAMPPAAAAPPGIPGSYGAPQAPPPSAAWNAPPPPPSMTPPAMAAQSGLTGQPGMTGQPPGPPRLPPPGPPSYGQPPGPPSYGQPSGQPPAPPSYGQHPGQPVPGHAMPQHGAPHGAPGQAYGQPPRSAYPASKPTSPLKLILLLGVFAVVGLIAVFALYVMFSGSDKPAATTTTTQQSPPTADPPPAPDATTSSSEPTEGTTQYADGSHGDFKPTTEAAPGPTWTEPQPTTGSEEPQPTAPAPTPVPTAPPTTPRRPTTGNQGDGGALARLGEAIGKDGNDGGRGDGQSGDETTDSGDGSEDGGYEAPAPHRPAPPAAKSAWDEAAAGARAEMETGLSFQFKITPPEAKVLFWSPDDRRAIVQGSAGEFDPKLDEEAKTLELPGDGQYLLILRHGDYPDYVIKVDAARSRGNRPKLLQFSLGRGGAGSSGSGSGGILNVRVSKAIAFAGTPADAYVFVDGRAAGQASDYPGGERRSGQNLKLDRGRHEVRLEARGFKTLIIKVEVAGGAPQLEQITYKLEKE